MTRDNEQKGVSVIIACHNGAARITETLQALSTQQFEPSLQWEVILVDNASTDDTASIARTIWDYISPGIELRIVEELQPGSGYARARGVRESAYSIVLFCDDDNRLCPEYIQSMYDILESDPSIAACGGRGIPVFQSPEPEWFHEYSEAFAIGSQEINRDRGRILTLYGAGLAIQKHALEQLHSIGFEPIMPGRVGKKLNASEDTELAYAFVLMGYTLQCRDELTFNHYLPAERLTKQYLKRLFAANGTDGPVRNLYYAYITNRIYHKKINNWYAHFLLSVVRMFKYFIVPPKKGGRFIYLHWSMAYIRSLVAIKGNFTTLSSRIEQLKQHAGRTSSFGMSCKPISLEQENII